MVDLKQMITHKSFFMHTFCSGHEYIVLSIQELLQKVLDFQAEAQEALVEETPNSTKLERLMEFGITLDVELPEIPKLKQVKLMVK